MRTRFALPFILALTLLLPACNPISSITPTPHGDPLAPTAERINPTEPTPTLHGEPLAPTPEVFIPLDPSPTPPESDLPLTCQVTDLKVQIERTAGYCYAFPNRFTLGKQPMFGFQAVMGPGVGSSAEPVFATFAVENDAYDPNQSLDQQVDAYLQGFTTVAPQSMTRARLTVNNEPAVMVDNIPVQLSWRIVFVQHQGRLYRLMYWPVDLKETKTDLEELYQTTLNSFSFIAGTISAASPTAIQEEQDSLLPSVTVNVDGVAQYISAQEIAAVPPSSNAVWWEPMPRYMLITLQGYPVANHLMQPQIFVYPVRDLEVNETAAKTAADLQKLLQDQQAGKALPFLPLYNSTQMMHAQVSYLDFKNGKGVRYLTQFAQGIVPINNHELIYTYQGLTSDGNSYVAAVLPVNLASLPTDGKWNGQEPPTGNDYRKYVDGVVSTLNLQPASTFTPDLNKLDKLIQSIEIK